MNARPRVGVACPLPGERAALLEWLAHSFEPVPMLDARSIARELDDLAFEVLIVDADLAEAPDTAFVLRGLGTNRPLIVIRDAATPSQTDRRGLTFLTRPVSRDELVLAVSLALAEGRPARKSPRRLVAHLQSTVDGVPARLVDVSYEGIRLELAETYRSTLPPFFTVKVPIFNVAVVGQRVWVNGAHDLAARGMFWCGVKLARNTERVLAAWHTLVEHAPASTALRSEARNYK